MSDKDEPKKKVGSWKFDPQILQMLEMNAKHEGESQVSLLRDYIRKDFKRRKLELPKP